MATRVERWRQIGTNVDVVISNGSLEKAVAAVRSTIASADLSFSRFRDDSELSLVNRSPGRRLRVSPLLVQAVDVALSAAATTDGLVDPALGSAVKLIGYDRDFDQLRGRDVDPVEHAPAAWQFIAVVGWRAVELDRARGTLRVPAGVELDLGSTGKALIVDLATRAAAEQLSVGGGVLVSIGGDMMTAGRPPRGGWIVQLAEDSGAPLDAALPVVAVHDGALATSSTTVRRWLARGELVHHLIDPRTGRPADGPWRTASVVAADCVTANTAATAAIVLGHEAAAWLEQRSLPARLVGRDGSVSYVCGWPQDAVASTASAA
jgi:thiamine biosynthesis lipoprotein